MTIQEKMMLPIKNIVRAAQALSFDQLFVLLEDDYLGCEKGNNSCLTNPQDTSPGT